MCSRTLRNKADDLQRNQVARRFFDRSRSQSGLRGFFARVFCVDEFRDHGLKPEVAQCSVSFNRCKGTLRGMHWQAAPKAEAKLIRCTRGAIFDVIVDLRPKSPTRLQHITTELSEYQWTHALHPGRVGTRIPDPG